MPAKLTLAQFIDRSHQAHGGIYDYTLAQYTTNNAKVTITCPRHGPFNQRASHHMDGHGCPTCKADATSTRCLDTKETFIAKARAIHGDTYYYGKVAYQRSAQKVQITCPTHGDFWQSPNSHITSRSGCPKCAGKAFTTADFIASAQRVHGDKFSYENTDYRLIKNKVTITCAVHGDFEQTAENHLGGRGCRFCWYESSQSAGENEVADWLTSLGFRIERNQRGLMDSNFEIDIYLPDFKAGIEYNGCYWHSDRHERNHRQQETKHAFARHAGLRLLTVWDFDWLHQPDIIKAHILHALGQSTAHRIGARQCTVVTLAHTAASAFYQQNHLQGPVRGGVVHLGLVHHQQLVAAMSFTRGGTRRGKASVGEWELARYATAAIVPGGASRLFKHFTANYQPAIVWSFSDQQSFAGDLYHRLGFQEDGKLPADYRVVHPRTLRVWHKSLWQRRSIPKRMDELGINNPFDPATDPRTERAIQDELRMLRVWDAGKTRWAWRQKNGITI